jgi:hypothetical protein
LTFTRLSVRERVTSKDASKIAELSASTKPRRVPCCFAAFGVGLAAR